MTDRRRKKMMDKYGVELYFGKAHPASVEMEGLVSELRELLLDAKVSDLNKGTLADKVETVTTRIENCIENHFGFKKVYFGVINNYDAYAYSLFINPKMYFKELEDGMVGRYEPNYIWKKLSELDKVVIDKTNGYKFKNDVDVTGIICIGLPIIGDRDMSVRTICGIIFHEIGHMFQHTLTGMQSNAIDTITSDIISVKLKEWHKSIARFPGLNLALCPIYHIFCSKFLISKNTVDSEDMVRMLANQLAYWKDAEGDRVLSYDQIGNDIKRNIKKSLSGYLRAKKKPDNFLSNLFLKLIMQPFVAILSLLIGALRLLTLPDSLAIHRNKHIDKYFYSEEFADHFALMYGFSELGQFFTTVYKMMDKNYNDRIIVGNIPIANDILELLEVVSKRSEMESQGGWHEVDDKRILQAYTSIKYELKHNRELDKKLKDELYEQMDLVEKNYKDLMDIKSKTVSFIPSIYKLIYKIKSKRSKHILENFEDNTPLISNVLELIKETPIDEKEIDKLLIKIEE